MRGLWLLVVLASWWGVGSGLASAQDYSWFEGDESKGSSRAEYGRGGSAGVTGSAGWGVGLRFGYALPLGNAFEGDDGLGGEAEAPLEDVTKGALKPQLDLTYGILDNFVLGAYFALGGGFQPDTRAKEACDQDGIDCQILVLESGLLAEYRVLPRSFVNPWTSVNLGVERLSTKVESPIGDFSTALLGVGFGAALGADLQFGGVGFGPFFSFQIGRFMRGKTDLGDLLDPDADASDGRKVDKDVRAYHYWLNFGLRVRYQFGA